MTPPKATITETNKDGINYLLWLSYATIGGLWIATHFIMIPYVIHLMVLVTAILYAACHHSLVLREEAAKAAASGESAEAVDTLKAEDAYQFPLVGSLSLFSLYCAFKYLDKDLVNLLIGLYFCAVGCLAVFVTLQNGLIDKTKKKSFQIKKSINHPLGALGIESPLKIDLEFGILDIILLTGSAVFCGFYFRMKHWSMNNILGICFCLQGIERFSLGTFKIGAILLIGLFFYDIFWVFGTDVMVSVAKNLDGPIKILFPRGYSPEGKLELSLLGLGDIVIPGFFLALLLRFDAHQADIDGGSPHASFSKPYFHSALVGYILGLGMTMYIMIVFQAAQPALLYLVPACLGSSLLCAAVRGELKELFQYSEEQEEETKEDAASKKKG
eukprot:CAMPEP_0178913464 /NCGR_PEP_ID=MMETSP0786-20121207/10856_1 /TAXON_ID=186022 /ORGANISM="Thalassionema frauenfeldii, Strain CCMP 1798" /LENGTH=385 /DNA_ID=CAMNT_0020586207 /DNA_START=61 /DNA_END=1218 /DNA_ORIENTATION=+